MRFLPHLIKPDFLTVANKSLTKNAENLYFSRILTLPRLLHTQEVHGSSPCVSTMKKALAFASAFFNEINLFRDLWNALRAWNTPAACEIAAAVRIYFISLDAKHQISQFTQWIISRRARRDISLYESLLRRLRCGGEDFAEFQTECLQMRALGLLYVFYA